MVKTAPSVLMHSNLMTPPWVTLELPAIPLSAIGFGSKINSSKSSLKGEAVQEQPMSTMKLNAPSAT